MAALGVLSPFLLALLVLHPNFPASEAADGPGSGSDYSYDPCSALGPQYWGHLKPEWAKCATGAHQSPISIKPSNVESKHLGPLQSYYTSQQATLLNKGHEIMVNWTISPGYILIDGEQFHLRQCHWHSPSEHELDGKRYPLELHMVHSTSDSKIAVIGVLHEFSHISDHFLTELENGLNDLKKVNQVDVGSIKPPSVEHGPYYRYNGSLTTPPCSEPVIWTVMKEVRSVTEKQVALLRAPVGNKDNARPVQPINARRVYLSKPPSEPEQDLASY